MEARANRKQGGPKAFVKPHRKGPGAKGGKGDFPTKGGKPGKPGKFKGKPARPPKT